MNEPKRGSRPSRHVDFLIGFAVAGFLFIPLLIFRGGKDPAAEQAPQEAEAAAGDAQDFELSPTAFDLGNAYGIRGFHDPELGMVFVSEPSGRGHQGKPANGVFIVAERPDNFQFLEVRNGRTNGIEVHRFGNHLRITEHVNGEKRGRDVLYDLNLVEHFDEKPAKTK